jgi:hypothetical protein
MSQEQHACTVVMGLSQPGELYEACIRSLDRSLSKLDQSRLIAAGRGTCAKKHFAAGTSAFADCVLDSEPAATHPGQ